MSFPPDLCGVTPSAFLDITTETCPMTFVRARLALDRLASGEILCLRLRGAEPALNVPRAASEQGHDVLAVSTTDDGSTIILLRHK